jgi:type IV secretory pathway TrbF-like protein
MAVVIDAKPLSAVVTGQQRNPLKEALRRPDKWNDRLSSIRLSSDFARIVDTRSGTIFAAVKLTQMLWLLKAAVIPDDSLSLS